jgi:hypothetical protein
MRRAFMAKIGRWVLVFAAVLVVSAPGSARASLIYDNTIQVSGSGLGTVLTVLTITSPANTSDEQGCVSFNGSADVIGSGACPVGFTGGDEQAGASQTLTRTFGEVLLDNARDIGIVFNPSEPASDSIQVDNLVLRIIAPDGTVVWDSGAFTPVSFPSSNPGVGNAGFVFLLDDAQALALNTAVFAFGSYGDYRIGLAADNSLATGGLDTFFVTNLDRGPCVGPDCGSTPAAVPAPAPVLMLGAGLLAAGSVRRLFRR